MYLARRSGYNLELDKSAGYEIICSFSAITLLDAAAFVVMDSACLAYGLLTGVSDVGEAWEEAEEELRFWRYELRTAAEEAGGVLALA